MKTQLKRIFLGALICLCILPLLMPAAAYNAPRYEQATLYFNNIRITLDGEEIVLQNVHGDILEPFIIAGTTYLPVRGIADALGLYVDWDHPARTVILSSTPLEAELPETAALFADAPRYQQATLYFNNIRITLDGEEIVPRNVHGDIIEPFILDGTTYLPVRGIADALGLYVSWDDANRTVILSSEWKPGPLYPHTVLPCETPEGFAGFAIYLEDRFTLEPCHGADNFFYVPSHRSETPRLMTIHQFQLPDEMTMEAWVYERIAQSAADGTELTYEPPTAEFPFLTFSPQVVLCACGIDSECRDGLVIQAFARDNGNDGLFHIQIMLFPSDWEEDIGPSLLYSLSTFELLWDTPLYPHTVLPSETPEGFAGFVIYLEDRFTLEPWLSEDGWFRVSDHLADLTIGQFPNIGMTVEEWVYEKVAEFAAGGTELTYEPPTAEFPFFTFPQQIVSGEGHVGQIFVRDNEKGGIFHIFLFMQPSEWTEGVGPSFMRSLASFEVL